MHHDSAHSQGSSKLLFIYVGVIVALAIIFADSIKKIAPMFQLTEADVNMIPVGALFFIVFWKLSEHFLFAPFVRLIEAREAATSGSEEESHLVLEQAKSLLDQTESQLFVARGKAVRDRDEELNRVRAVCAAGIAEANNQAKNKVEEQRSLIAREVDALRVSLDAQIDQLAADVVQRIKCGAVGEAK